MQGSSDAGGTAGRGGYIRSGMPDRGLPFQPGRDPKGAVEAQRAQDPAKPRRITSLGDIHVSRAYAVRERYRHRNDGGGVALNGNWLLVGSRNQFPKRLLASTVIDEADGARVWPEAALNAKIAWVTSRAVEKPVTTMLIVFPFRFT